MADKPIIKYTNRDFNSIREDLIEYTKRKYPNTFKDFSANSPVSWYINLVSYLGDQLSFNLDYYVNESFLDSSIESKNVIRLGRSLGYKHNPAKCSYGTATFYITVPADNNYKPDLTYLPILRKGTELMSTGGVSFLLIEDVVFSKPGNEIVVANVDTTTGSPISYAVRAYGQVVSGEIKQLEIDVTDYQKFLLLELSDTNIIEIISVTDSEGYEYYEVDYLSNDVIYKAEVNRTSDASVLVPNIIKPYPVPRRFISFFDNNKYYIQFGYGSENDLETEDFLDPSNIVLQRLGKNYISDQYFDPSRLINNDKFGIVPSNTTLKIIYRRNSSFKSNIAVGTLQKVSNAKFDFGSSAALNQTTMRTVISSLEVDNEEPIVGDIYYPSLDEIKNRIYGTFSSQNRAVTRKDYESIIYNMPSAFGAVKRCSVRSGHESGERILNSYVICEDVNGHLVKAPDSIKNNLKVWIGKHKMINDTVQILDTRVINFGVNFIAIAKNSSNASLLYSEVYDKIKDLFKNHLFIGEPLNIVNIYSAINSVTEIADTTDVIITELSGGLYSSHKINLDNWKTSDGRLIVVPQDVILELKYPNLDIRGIIK